MSYKNHTQELYSKVNPQDVPRKHTERERPLTYIPISNVILRCDTAIIHETGEEVSITSEVKLVYTYMRERFAYCHSSGKHYYESWESIASIIGRTSSVFKHKEGRVSISEALVKVGLLELTGGKTKRSAHKVVKDVSDVLGEVTFHNKFDDDYLVKRSEAQTRFKESKVTPEDVNTAVHEAYYCDLDDPPF